MKYLILALLLTGCVASGQEYAYHANRTVIYREYNPIIRVQPWSTIINGKSCDLHNGSYVEAISPTVITADITMLPGTSHITVKKPAFIRMTMNGNKNIVGAMGGLFGRLATEEGSGPFIFENVDAATAKRELVGLKQDCI